MIKAVLFDADGVVFDSCDSQGRFIWKSSLKEDLGLSEEQIKPLFKDGRMFRGEIGTVQQVSEFFRDSSIQSVTAVEFIEYWHSKDSNVNAQILELVDRVKVPRYMATNQEKLRLARFRTLVGSHFQQVFGSAELGVCKPDPRFFTKISDTLGLKPEEVLMIDDDKKYISGASEAGLQVHLFTGFEELRNDLQLRNLLN